MHLLYPNEWDLDSTDYGLKTRRVIVIGGPKQQPDANPNFKIFFLKIFRPGAQIYVFGR